MYIVKYTLSTLVNKHYVHWQIHIMYIGKYTLYT